MRTCLEGWAGFQSRDVAAGLDRVYERLITDDSDVRIGGTRYTLLEVLDGDPELPTCGASRGSTDPAPSPFDWERSNDANHPYLRAQV